MLKTDGDPPNNENYLTINNSQSFKSKTAFVGETVDAAGGNNFAKSTNAVFPLKYLRNFWRSLEISLISFKLNL